MFHPDSAFRHRISFSGNYFFESNAITNRFALSYYQKEFIDNSEKDNVSDNLGLINRLGIQANMELNYTKRNDTVFGLPHSYYSVGIANRYHINSRFRQDVFELYFRGNKNYEGKEADLSDFVYNQIYYQQINFTFGHSYNHGQNTFGFSAGLDFNKGQKFYRIDAPHATLFTEIYGESLDLDANIKLRQSDSSTTDIFTWNGTGGSADLSFWWSDKKRNRLNFSVGNVGFIQWSKNSTYVKADTSFRFEGIDVSYLFDLEDTIKRNLTLDSSLVEPYLSEREKKNYMSPLPCLLDLNYEFNLQPGEIDLGASVSYLLFAESQIRGSASLNYTINYKHRLSLLLNYGRYSRIQAGLAYKVMFLQRWMLNVGSDFLSSMLDSKNGTAQGAFLSLSAYF